MTTIDAAAFHWLFKMESVYYGGTAEEKALIDVKADNDSLQSATWYYYVETQADVPMDGGNYWYYDENGEIVVAMFCEG